MHKFMKKGERERRLKCKRIIENVRNFRANCENDVEEPREELEWADGRRVVNLGKLSDGLKGCQSCDIPLQLNNTLLERRYGLASVLYVKCATCSYINPIHTDTTHPGGGMRGPEVFNANSKIALGMVDAGIGPRQVNKLLGAIGIPIVSSTTIKKREREMTKSISEVADQSCKEALEQEIELSREIYKNDREISTPGLKVKYDMCWQKRGSGRSYSSLSGVGSVIGEQSGKVLSFHVCNKHCRSCTVASNLNKDKASHQCFRNWQGSSKAMEANTGAHLMQTLEKQSSFPIETLIMDDDSATISKVKQVLRHDIEKWSDSNHSKKSVGKALYMLQSKHKIITRNVIDLS